MLVVFFRNYTVLHDKGSCCFGGDDLLGLYLVDGDTEVDVTVGDTVVGRKSRSFLGKVVAHSYTI